MDAAFLNRADEERRLLDAVRLAFETPSRGSASEGTRSAVLPASRESGKATHHPNLPIGAAPPPPPPLPPTPSAPPLSAERPSLGSPYQLATLQQVCSNFQDYYLPQSVPVIEKVLLGLIEAEAPILLREATGRVTQCWNNRALTQRALQTTQAIAQELHRRGRLYLDAEETLWSNHGQSAIWQEFRRAPDGGRTMAAVPPAERRAALEAIALQALSIDMEALLREASLCLTGGSRFSQPQRQAIQEALEQLLAADRVHLKDGRVFSGPAG